MATLEYDFRIIGMDAVAKGFASLERRAKAHNDAMARMFGRNQRAGTGGITGGAGPRGGAQPTLPSRQRAAQTQETRDHERQLRARQQREERAAREQQRLQERQLREERRAAQAREKEREREWNRRQAMHRKEERAAVRTMEREEAAGIARSRRRRGAIIGAVGGALSDLGSRALDFAKLGAGGVIAMGLNAGRNAYRESTALAAQSKQAGNTASMRDIHKDILDTSRKVTESMGVDRATVIRSMAGFHGVAGSLEAAKTLAPYMATAAEATGADANDISRLTGMAFMRAQAKGMSTKEATEAAKNIVGIFGAHAAKGTIEMSDYASVGPEILSAASQMQSPQGFVQAAAIASAIAQGSIGGGATSAAEAATATSRLIDDMTKNYERIKKVTAQPAFGGKTVETMGIDPVTGVRKVKSFEETIPQLLAAAQGDVSRLMAMGIDVRGNRAMKGFLDTYIEGTKRTGPGTAEEKGAAAVREAILTASKGGISEKDFAEMAKAREELDPYTKLERALTQLADTAMPPLTEAVQALAEVMKKPETKALVEDLGKGVQFVAENPLASLGIYAGGKALLGAGSSYLSSALGLGAAEGAAATGAGALLSQAGAAVTGAGALGVGALALGTVGAVGSAVYNAFKLHEEMNTPFMSEADFNPSAGGVPPVAAAPTPAGGRPPGTPAGATAAANGTQLNDAAAALKDAATALKNSASASNLNRSDAPGTPAASAGGR